MLKLYLVEFKNDPDEEFKILKEIGTFKNDAELRQALWRLPKYHAFDRKCYMIKKEQSADLQNKVLPFKS